MKCKYIIWRRSTEILCNNKIKEKTVRLSICSICQNLKLIHNFSKILSRGHIFNLITGKYETSANTILNVAYKIGNKTNIPILMTFNKLCSKDPGQWYKNILQHTVSNEIKHFYVQTLWSFFKKFLENTYYEHVWI